MFTPLKVCITAITITHIYSSCGRIIYSLYYIVAPFWAVHLKYFSMSMSISYSRIPNLLTAASYTDGKTFYINYFNVSYYFNIITYLSIWKLNFFCLTSHILRSLLVFVPLDFNLSLSIVTHMYYLHESFIALFLISHIGRSTSKLLRHKCHYAICCSKIKFKLM